MAKVKSIPTTLNRYRVARSILTDSASHLRTMSNGVREAIILWRGRVEDERTADITGIVVPEQLSGRLQFNVPLAERMRIAREMATTDEFVLIQVHTHPGRAFHSEADDEMALTKHTGAVSIVVPQFARSWGGELEKTAVFTHLGGSLWRPLTPREVAAWFEVLP